MRTGQPDPRHPRVTFIGGGNMAAALIGGLRVRGWPAKALRVAERDAERRRWLTEALGVEAVAAAATAKAEAIVVAVKPHQMADAVSGLRPPAGCTVLSIAAGIRTSSLRRWLGSECAIVRAMPNTPALAGAGATGLYADPTTPAGARSLAQTLIDAVGISFWVEQESQLDAVTALSGSGPAYFLLLAESMSRAAEVLGLPPEVAAGLARQTLIGSGRLLENQNTESPTTLRARITSKGGTTAAAVESLEKSGFHAIVQKAMSAAAARSRELGAEPAAPAASDPHP